jgi:hypothetical protein
MILLDPHSCSSTFGAGNFVRRATLTSVCLHIHVPCPGSPRCLFTEVVCVVCVPLCVRVSRVSRVCPGSPRCLFTEDISQAKRIFFPTPVGTPGGKPLRLTARVKIARARPDRFWPADPFFFFFGYLSYNHHRSRPPPRSHHPTATHALRIDHSLHSESHPPFAPLRGVATRHVSATSSRFRTCEGVLHWRLLGALNNRDARAAYSRRIVAPSSSLRPLPLDRAAPAPLCSAQAIDPIQSVSRHSSSAPCHPTGPPHPV